MQKAANVYMQTQVGTTDQGQLLLLLYDGALTFLAQARDKMLARDFAAKGQLISRAIDIVNELASSLNMEKGGSLAENLNNLYFLCTARLLQANLKMNVEQLDSVVSILSGLRGAYAQIIDKPEARQAVQQIAARMQPDVGNHQRIMNKNVSSAPSGMGQLQARAAYQMAAKMPGQPAAAPVSEPLAPPAAPLEVSTPSQAANMQAAGASAPQPGFAQAAREAMEKNKEQQPAVKIPYQNQPQPAENTAPAVANAAESADSKPEQAPARPAATKFNFNKSLAAYGKVAM